MTAFLKHIAIKFIQSAIKILFIFPILLLITVIELPITGIFPVISGLSVFYLTGILVGYFLKDKSNALYIGISSIIGLITYFIIGFLNPFSILYTIMITVSIFRGIRISSSNWIKQSPVPVFTLLFTLYFIFNALFLTSDNLYRHKGLLNISGFAMIAVFLPICSFDQLKAAFFKSENKIYIP